MHVINIADLFATKREGGEITGKLISTLRESEENEDRGKEKNWPLDDCHHSIYICLLSPSVTFLSFLGGRGSLTPLSLSFYHS